MKKHSRNKWIHVNKELPPLHEVVEVKLYHIQEIRRARRLFPYHSLFFSKEHSYDWIGQKVLYWRRLPSTQG